MMVVLFWLCSDIAGLLGGNFRESYIGVFVVVGSVWFGLQITYEATVIYLDGVSVLTRGSKRDVYVRSITLIF